MRQGWGASGGGLSPRPVLQLWEGVVSPCQTPQEPLTPRSLLPPARGTLPMLGGGCSRPGGAQHRPPPRADPGSAALVPPGEAETSDGDREQKAAARGRQAAAAASQGEDPPGPPRCLRTGDVPRTIPPLLPAPAAEAAGPSPFSAPQSKALRERWLLEGAPTSASEEDEAMKKQMQEDEVKTKELEETIQR